MSDRPTRRRFIAIAGAVAGLSIAPGLSMAAPHRVNWSGRALGGEASISLYHHDRPAAEKIVAACSAEIIRLEKIFSLFQSDSKLVRLNRDGQLTSPPVELVSLVRLANGVSRISGGAFDITVQPLWALYAGHFSKTGADPDGPGREAVDKARNIVDWRNISVSEDRLSFIKPGMAITMNGIAQGYIADRITDILHQNGIDDLLVDLGEFRAMGEHPDGRPWRVGVSDPLNESGLLDAWDLRDRAIASSGPYGTILDAAGRFHHLFDPKDGRPARHWAGVTVMAKKAATADALSTALAVMEPKPAKDLIDAIEGVKAILVSPDGTILRTGS